MPTTRDEGAGLGLAAATKKEEGARHSPASVARARIGSLATMARTVNLAVIPGDGIGTEVVAEGLKVLAAVAPAHGLTFTLTHYDLGATRYNATGETLPASSVLGGVILAMAGRRPESRPEIVARMTGADAVARLDGLGGRPGAHRDAER